MFASRWRRKKTDDGKKKQDDGKANDLAPMLRVIALKEFDTRKLVLPPWIGIEANRLLISKKEEQMPMATKKQSKKDSSDDHPTTIKSARVRVMPKKDDRRPKRSRGGDAESSEKLLWNGEGFVAQTPLREKMDPDTYGSISPLWALNLTNKSCDVNVQMDFVTFDFSHMAPTDGFKMPNVFRRPTYSVSIECAVNTKKIKAGDVLCISVMRCGGDESEVDETEIVDDCATTGGA